MIFRKNLQWNKYCFATESCAASKQTNVSPIRLLRAFSRRPCGSVRITVERYRGEQPRAVCRTCREKWSVQVSNGKQSRVTFADSVTKNGASRYQLFHVEVSWEPQLKLSRNFELEEHFTNTWSLFGNTGSTVPSSKSYERQDRNRSWIIDCHGNATILPQSCHKSSQKRNEKSIKNIIQSRSSTI